MIDFEHVMETKKRWAELPTGERVWMTILTLPVCAALAVLFVCVFLLVIPPMLWWTLWGTDGDG